MANPKPKPFASPRPIAMNQEPKSDYEAAKELREAQLKYAAVSIGRRYESAQQVTGMSTAERVASLTTNRLIAKCLNK